MVSLHLSSSPTSETSAGNNKFVISTPVKRGSVCIGIHNVFFIFEASKPVLRIWFSFGAPLRNMESIDSVPTMISGVILNVWVDMFEFEMFEFELFELFELPLLDMVNYFFFFCFSFLVCLYFYLKYNKSIVIIYCISFFVVCLFVCLFDIYIYIYIYVCIYICIYVYILFILFYILVLSPCKNKIPKLKKCVFFWEFILSVADEKNSPRFSKGVSSDVPRIRHKVVFRQNQGFWFFPITWPRPG